MELGELITSLQAEDPAKVLPHGFADPHSWRGDYYDLAFSPARNVTVGSMLAAALSAVGATYQGWKGGDYTMTVDSDCYLAEPRDLGETLGPTLLRLMLDAGSVPAEPAPAEPTTTQATVARMLADPNSIIDWDLVQNRIGDTPGIDYSTAVRLISTAQITVSWPERADAPEAGQ